MPGITGLETTFNSPNYTGEILTITPTETPFLSAIGGLNGGGEMIAARQFEWQTQDYGTPSIPAVLEGADAPTMTERTRGTVNNVTQIFQYAFGASYTRLAAVQQLAGLAIGGASNPATNEIAYQTNIKLTEAARDINYTFLNGVYALPGDNATARTTRGLLAAISTNRVTGLGADASVTGTASNDTVTWTAHGLAVGDVLVFSALTGGAGLVINTPYYVRSVVDANTVTLAASPGGALIDITTNMTAGTAAAGAKLTKGAVLDMVQRVWGTAGINGAAEPTLLCNATIKRSLTKLFITDSNYQEMTRNVGGVSLTSIITDFGNLNIMIDRMMPVNQLALVHLGVCEPAYLPIPGKGFLFVEPLAKTGAQDKYQLYGEIGLKYGHETQHAAITYVSPVAGA